MQEFEGLLLFVIHLSPPAAQLFASLSDFHLAFLLGEFEVLKLLLDVESVRRSNLFRSSDSWREDWFFEEKISAILALLVDEEAILVESLQFSGESQFVLLSHLHVLLLLLVSHQVPLHSQLLGLLYHGQLTELTSSLLNGEQNVRRPGLHWSS
jgi:hypothetical protein